MSEKLTKDQLADLREWLTAAKTETSIPASFVAPLALRALDELAAAEERGRRAEHDRAQSVIHVLHQCIRGKCACEDSGAISQFACEETARKAIDAWDLAPRDSGKENGK